MNIIYVPTSRWFQMHFLYKLYANESTLITSLLNQIRGKEGANFILGIIYAAFSQINLRK